jgi:hypothetical protein
MFHRSLLSQDYLRQLHQVSRFPKSRRAESRSAKGDPDAAMNGRSSTARPIATAAPEEIR